MVFGGWLMVAAALLQGRRFGARPVRIDSLYPAGGAAPPLQEAINQPLSTNNQILNSDIPGFAR